MYKIIYKNYQDMCREAARMIARQLQHKPDSVLGLATGSTPIGMYRELARMYQAGHVDFSQATSFNLDEYYPIEKNNPQSYHYFMDRYFFQHINMNPNQIHIPDGNAKSPEEECKNYDVLLERAGGIDLQILGIGANGHIGFNEPASELSSATHLTPLSPETIHANSRFFERLDLVPGYAITMGMSNILKAKKIILLISGKNKAEIVHKLFRNQITTSIPASLLQLHPDTTVMIDSEAARSTAC